VLCQRVRQRSYPVVVRNGIVFAWLGEGEAPAFPDFDCFLAPGTHAFAFKGMIDCNWLQALEVGIDPAHASYLHRFYEDEDPSGDGLRQAVPRQLGRFQHPDVAHDARVRRPTIDVEGTDYGLRLFTLRKISEKHTHVRVTNLVFPYAFVIPMSTEMTITQWHVPIDDTSCYWYAIFTSFGKPVDHQQMREQRLQLYELPDYRPRIGRHNNYGYEVAEQKTQTYTGMGFDINVTTSGRSRARAASRTARASISAPATRRSSPIAACCCRRSARSPTAASRRCGSTPSAPPRCAGPSLSTAWGPTGRLGGLLEGVRRQAPLRFELGGLDTLAAGRLS
jgi:hypothetical protein